MKDGIAKPSIDDSLVTTRLQEELDFFSNMKKEGRIVVSGLMSQIPMPSNTKEKRNGLGNWLGLYWTRWSPTIQITLLM
jgi:hypothetical protein